MLVKINKCSQYHVIVILALALLLGSCSKRVETPYIVIEDFPVDSTLSPLPLPQLDELPGIYDISSVGDYISRLKMVRGCISMTEPCKNSIFGRYLRMDPM